MEKLSFKLEAFEGPLDLLLHLIQKNKVSIYDIPIAIITKQYLEYISQMEQMDLEVTGDFLVIAAQLLLIKSKMLLPKHNIEEEAEDPREELVLRLLEYKRHKIAAEYLDTRKNVLKNAFFKPPEVFPKEKPQNTPLPIDALTAAFYDVLERLNRKQPPPKELFSGIVGLEKVSVSSRVKIIQRLIKKDKRVSFLKIFEGMSTRVEIVASFLAILELIRQNKIGFKGKKSGDVILFGLE